MLKAIWAAPFWLFSFAVADADDAPPAAAKIGQWFPLRCLTASDEHLRDCRLIDTSGAIPPAAVHRLEKAGEKLLAPDHARGSAIEINIFVPTGTVLSSDVTDELRLASAACAEASEDRSVACHVDGQAALSSYESGVFRAAVQIELKPLLVPGGTAVWTAGFLGSQSRPPPIPLPPAQ